MAIKILDKISFTPNSAIILYEMVDLSFRSVIEPLRWILDVPLHLLQERLEHLPRGSLEQMLSLVVVLLVDSLADQELRCLIGEHVAVVVDDIVLFCGVLEGYVLQEVLVDLLGDLCLAQHDFLDGFAEGSGLGWVCADAGPEVVLLSEGHKRGVVDGIDLLPDHHHAEALGHSHGDIVDKEGDSAAHLI